jgi:hypothetical protein
MYRVLHDVVLREDKTLNPCMYSKNVQGLGLRFHEPKVSFV